MATISHSDLAPSEKVHYSLAGEGGEFDLTAKGSHETDNAEVLQNAEAHPWLKVEYPAVTAELEGGDLATVDYPRTAIDAGLDQKVAQYEGENAEIPVAETLAADDEQGDEPIVVDEPTDDNGDE